MILKVRHLVTVAGVDDNGSQQSQAAAAAQTSKKRVGRGHGSGQRHAGGTGTRARSRGRATGSSAGSRAARCRSTAGFRSAGSTTRSGSEYRSSTSTRWPSLRRRHVVTPNCCVNGSRARRARSHQGAGARRHQQRTLTVRAHKFSGKAAEKIAAAGGAAEAHRKRRLQAAGRRQRSHSMDNPAEEPLRRHRPAQPRAVHAGAARRVPRRQPIPTPGVNRRRWRYSPSRRRTRCSASTTCSPAATCRR